ncbi:MAG: CDP-glycerol--glycerophosphate glycerophosphotransferase, partial [Lysobacterales bacterium CG_4_9_14_3_um_filter_62_6]
MASATEQPRAAVIVPIYNAAAVLRDCLESLRRTLTADDQLILIDDASSDPEIGALLATFADQAPCPLRLERNA